jgi:beta-mannosidase
LFLLLTSCWTTSASAEVPRVQLLDGGWQFRLAPGDAQAADNPNATQWRSAVVPGHVHTDLLSHRLIDDPYIGAPEAGLQWIGLAQWEYRRTFDVPARALRRAHHELLFDGLDTFADVYLNGQKLLSADNAFRAWRIPVGGRLKPRGNDLLVVFHSPIRRVLPHVQSMTYKLKGNYPSPYGDEPADALTGNFVRKPNYHYGWDWGPRYVTAGIWRTVRLESRDHLRLVDFHVQQQLVTADAAELNLTVEIEADRSGEATLEADYIDPFGRRSPATRRTLTLQTGYSRETLSLTITRPHRWYPTGYGEQALYTFRARVLDAQGLQAKASSRTGLRSVELRREHDQWGQGFAFAINDIPVFAKGANVIPFDMFPNRVTQASVRHVLQSASDAGMNMLRNWGGGYYESDAFYDLADKLGIMIWQDFMFGGGVVPAYDPAFRVNVIAEARDQVRRLRSHPSIVLWCGNNEMETAWKDWGYGKELTAVDALFAEKVWEGYRQLFGVELREVVAREGNGVPYWSSSPGNDLAERSNDSTSGDKHYWDVWAGSKPVEEYLRETPRFMSEFGLQAWPVQSTLDTFASRKLQEMDGPVIRAHQKFLAGAGNDRLLHYIRTGYGEPQNFPEFVYLSQVMQAEGVALAALHHRASRPRTMGTLYWQLNDVWPGASWSSIDYFGRWKALHFHARRFFAPLAVAALRDGGSTRVALVSDRTEPVTGDLRLRVMDFDGRLLRDERSAVTQPALSATSIAEYTDSELLGDADPTRTLAVFDLLVDGRTIARCDVYFAAAKDLALSRPTVNVRWRKDGRHYRLDLQADRITRALWIDFDGIEAVLSDNALTLLPGERLTLQVRSKAGLDDLRRRMRLRSLADISRP